MLWNSNTKQIYNSLERPVESAKQAVLSQRQQNAWANELSIIFTVPLLSAKIKKLKEDHCLSWIDVTLKYDRCKFVLIMIDI